MRAPSSILTFLLLSLTAIAAQRDHRGGDRKWLIDGSCGLIAGFDRSVPKEYCMSALHNAQYDEKEKLSLHSLACISLQLLEINVKATKEKVESLKDSPSVQADPKLKEIMGKCSSMYSEATSRTKTAKKYIEENNYMWADRTVSMIQGDGSECETEFTYAKLPSPLTKENLDAQYLSTITTLLIRFFDKSYTPDGVPILKHT